MTQAYHNQNLKQESEHKGSNTGELLAKKVTRAIWIFFSVIEALLGFRLLLKLFAANPASLFAEITYKITDFFVFPFHNLVVNPTFGNGVFEITTLIAILAYMFFSWLSTQIATLILFKK